MIGKKFYKNDYNIDEYFEASSWCNANGAKIADKGDYYEIVENPPYVPTEAEIQQHLTTAVQAYMDSAAQTRGYDNIHTACTYANSTDHVFAAEGLACVAWRDTVWRTCYNILDAVKAGERAIPTKEELLAELPALEW